MVFAKENAQKTLSKPYNLYEKNNTVFIKVQKTYGFCKSIYITENFLGSAGGHTLFTATKDKW